MTWVVWRQQRPALIALAAALIAGVVGVLLLRAGTSADLAAPGMGACVGDGTQRDPECGSAVVMSFQDTWFDRMKIGQTLVLALPALIGVFVGAPLFAREYEQGTHELAFTQSTSRTRWMATKFLLTALPSALVLVTLQLVVGGWLETAGRLGPLKTGPFTFLNFETSGISPFAYFLFAYTLGTFAGALTKRTLMSMTLTLGVFVVIRFVFSNIRMFMLTPQRLISDDPSTSAKPDDNPGLVLKSGHLDATGNVVADSGARTLDCGARGNDAIPGDLATCYREHGLAKSFSDVIPADAATSLHLLEASVFLGFAALFVLGTLWSIRRQF